MPLALCPQIMFQAQQHFRSCEIQAICDRGFARLSFRSSPACPGQLPTSIGVLEAGHRTLTHASLDILFHFSLFVVVSLNPWEWWHVWSDYYQFRQSSGCQLPSPLSAERLTPCRLHYLHGWWLHRAWQWNPTLTDLLWLSRQCTLRSCALLFSWMWS